MHGRSVVVGGGAPPVLLHVILGARQRKGQVLGCDPFALLAAAVRTPACVPLPTAQSGTRSLGGAGESSEAGSQRRTTAPPRSPGTRPERARGPTWTRPRPRRVASSHRVAPSPGCTRSRAPCIARATAPARPSSLAARR